MSSAPTVLALDLEGTLISNIFSLFVRPHLWEFLEVTRTLFDRVVMYSAASDQAVYASVSVLVQEESAPGWFGHIPRIKWSRNGPKDLRRVTQVVPDAVDISRIWLVEDQRGYVHDAQLRQWIPIQGYDQPYASDDNELPRVLAVLRERSAQCQRDATD
jgi:hypothetical protein